MGKTNLTKWQRIKHYLNHLLLPASLSLLVGCVALDADMRTGSSSDSPELTPPPNFTRGLITRRVAEPFYPLRAQNLGIKGWVMVEFSVDQNGEVIGNSIRTIEEEPEGYFQQSALNAARRMLFDNTRGQILDDIRYVFRFELDEQNSILVEPPSEEVEFRELIPMRYITPNYPEIAMELGIEGYVIVEFSVTAVGAVENVSIIESEPPGVFNEEAINAALRLRFEPRIIFDGPVRVDNVQYRFDWRLPN
ncbi:MAG: energy transducer TonB [Gammaproteobacteria bacterium]|nr:energy transducer TonB [Gammaproteobacteria bacterium]MDD9895981.1 energy transducer TonB [Gammaproteobacteria bacterium]MDD9958493.1 energy transducer TonB [Gammaproteobacteria bacterium]